MDQVKVGVGVFIHRGNGQVLYGLRQGSHGSGTWGLPGGKLEFGESAFLSATREAFEETGLEIQNLERLGYTEDYFFPPLGEDPTKGLHYITLYVSSQVVDPEANPVVKEPQKCIRWEWFDYSKPPSPLFLPLQNFFGPQQ